MRYPGTPEISRNRLREATPGTDYRISLGESDIVDVRILLAEFEAGF